MATSADRRNGILEQMTPEDVPEFLRTIAFFEWCGIISRAQANDWRRRFLAWVDHRFGFEVGRQMRRLTKAS